jgi:hypothetical protein
MTPPCHNLSASHSELRVPLEREEAYALGLLVKRLTWEAVRECAQDDGEARIMLAALERVRLGLADIGVAPR